MKKILLLIPAFLLVGCASITRPFFRPVLGTNQVPAHVETRTTLATNLVPTVVTNSAGAVVIATQTNVVATVTPTYIPPSFVVVTNGWEQRPGIDTGIQIAAGATNIVAPGVGSIVSYAATGILALWGAFLNRKAKTATETAAGLVKGVEAFRQAALLTPVGTKMSEHLIDQIKANIPAATQAGLLLEQLVDQHTGNTSGQAEFIKAQTVA
jgi:hypothetical protein